MISRNSHIKIGYDEAILFFLKRVTLASPRIIAKGTGVDPKLVYIRLKALAKYGAVREAIIVKTQLGFSVSFWMLPDAEIELKREAAKT